MANDEPTMKNCFYIIMIAFFLVVSVLILQPKTQAQNTSPSSNAQESSPLFGVTLPAGYRDWRLISVAREEGNLDNIRAILGNDTAITAYREGKRPFPDGTILA